LLDTSLFGVDSHGVERVFHYFEKFMNGSIVKNPELNIIETSVSTRTVDGADGHGIIIMNQAVMEAVDILKISGIAAIGIKNSSHCGAIGLYTRKLAKCGYIGISMTHADSLVVAHGSSKPFFGTNPISISFPSVRTNEIICLDMATSKKPWNFIMNARANNEKIESDIAINSSGIMTENPHDATALMPIGGYKGFGLGFMIDLFCGPLNGMLYGPRLTSMYKDVENKRKLGSFLIAIDPMKFQGDRMFHILEDLLSDVSKLNSVKYPGQIENENYIYRLKNGIPLSESFILQSHEWSRKLRISSLIK